MKALVVFFDPEDAKYQWLLKPGFRHVFCCINDERDWIMIDGRNGRPVVQVVQDSMFDLKEYFEDEGYTVVEMERSDRPIRSPLVLTNCVGLVKIHLCIRSHALTPYQLYRHLKGTGQ